MSGDSSDHPTGKLWGSNSIVEDVFLVPTSETAKGTQTTNEGGRTEEEKVKKGKEKEGGKKNENENKNEDENENENENETGLEWVVKRSILNTSESWKLGGRGEASAVGLDALTQSYRVGEAFWPAEYTNELSEVKKRRNWSGRGKTKFELSEEGKANREAWLEYWRQNHANCPSELGNSADENEQLDKNTSEHSNEENTPGSE